MKPILLNLPVRIITKRLILRPPMPGDGAELNAAILNSFDKLHVWMPWAMNKPTVEESEENARRAYAQWILREDLRFSIFQHNSNTLVGSSGLHRLNWNIPSCEIGYWVRSTFAGEGFITEATAALCRYAFKFLNIKRLEIKCDPDNLSSIRVAERLGFKKEAFLQKNKLKPGTNLLRDTLIFVRFDVSGLPNTEIRWNE